MMPTKQAMTESGAPIVLVTGGSSGIGKSIAYELGRRGCRVYAASRSLADFFDDPDNKETKPESWLRTVRLDVHSPGQGGQVVEKIVAEEGRLDILVQAAGFGIAGPVEITAHEEARSQMETNFFGSISLLPVVLEQMRKQRSGLIVNIGSVAGFLPIPFQAYYSASKAALASLTLALDDEVRPYGIRCMIVQPGDTQTGFTNARIVSQRVSESEYSLRCERSLLRMEQDEQNGMSSDKVARIIVRYMLRRNPPVQVTCGFVYKLYALAARLLPVRLARWIIARLYAG